MSNIQECNQLLTILYRFYNSIINDEFKQITKYLNQEKTDLINIDFTKQFVSSNIYKDKFINYDKQKNLFHISLDISKKRFNELKNNSFYGNKNVNIFDNDLCDSDLILLVKNNNISFEDYIKGEFIYELFSMIINLKIDENIIYKNEFGYYHKPIGTYLTYAAIEYLTRDFTSRNNIFYLPRLDYQELVLKVKNIIEDNNIQLLFNGNISVILENQSNSTINIIKKLEEKYFEEEFKIKKGILQEEELEYLKYKNTSIQKLELKEELNNLKNQINKQVN